MMRQKVWVYNPHKVKRIISERTKLEMKFMCDEFVEEYLRPHHIHPFNPQNKKEAQCVDIRWKWYRHFIHFIAIYKDIRPDVLQEEYRYPIARLEYLNENELYLAYFRHTGEWWTLSHGKGNSLKECFELIQTLPHFSII